MAKTHRMIWRTQNTGNTAPWRGEIFAIRHPKANPYQWNEARWEVYSAFSILANLVISIFIVGQHSCMYVTAVETLLHYFESNMNDRKPINVRDLPIPLI